MIGVRVDGNKHVILDHIRTGWRIGRFPNRVRARAAIRELMGITDFKWTKPPESLKAAVVEILRRYQ